MPTLTIHNPITIQQMHNHNLGREELVVMNLCLKYNIPHTRESFATTIESSATPVGSCRFCEAFLSARVTPDYYPEWLKDHLHRKIWLSKTWPQKQGIFVKPANEYKKFTGFITRGGWSGKKGKGPYWCSEVVNFVNEWRYYVSNGEVLVAAWYSGDDENAPAPELDVTIPKDYCGALDFGLLDTEELALVEAQHPYAIGWYGGNEDNLSYLKFLVDGWEYMRKHYTPYQSIRLSATGELIYEVPTATERLLPKNGLPLTILIPWEGTYGTHI